MQQAEICQGSVPENAHSASFMQSQHLTLTWTLTFDALCVATVACHRPAWAQQIVNSTSETKSHRHNCITGTTHILHTSYCSKMQSEILWNVLVNLWALTRFTRHCFCVHNHSQTFATICHRLWWVSYGRAAGEGCTVSRRSWYKFLKCV